jgi:hypothetical protein
MTQTNPDIAARTRAANNNASADRRPANQRQKFLTTTETRRSFMTSEFWLTLVAAAVMIVVGYADDNGLGVNRAWALTAGVIGLYILSRGIAKAGSSDTEVRDLDDFS